MLLTQHGRPMLIPKGKGKQRAAAEEMPTLGAGASTSQVGVSNRHILVPRSIRARQSAQSSAASTFPPSDSNTQPLVEDGK
jgi:hypothetical protein